MRPAINVGISVSRVGGNAQTKAMKKVAGRLRLDLAQYRDLEAFAQFGSELDPVTQRTLANGERMVSTLNQPQYSPWPFEEQVAAIFAGINGYLADIPTPQVPRFQEELREHLRAEGSVYAAIRDAGDLPDELQETLHARDQEAQGALQHPGRGEPRGDDRVVSLGGRTGRMRLRPLRTSSAVASGPDLIRPCGDWGR